MGLLFFQYLFLVIKLYTFNFRLTMADGFPVKPLFMATQQLRKTTIRVCHAPVSLGQSAAGLTSNLCIWRRTS